MKKIFCFTVDEINKETVILAKTDHRCTNCKYDVPDNGGDNSGYCKKRKSRSLLNLDKSVCREWEKKISTDDD